MKKIKCAVCVGGSGWRRKEDVEERGLRKRGGRERRGVVGGKEEKRVRGIVGNKYKGMPSEKASINTAQQSNE